MKIKFLILGLFLTFFISCTEIENPYSPNISDPPEETKEALIEFITHEPWFDCPDYNPLLEYQRIHFYYHVANNGTAPAENINIIVRMYDSANNGLLFEILLPVLADKLCPPNGGCPHDIGVGTSFEMDTNTWDKYVNGEAYKDLEIIWQDVN